MPSRLHQALIEDTMTEQLVGHVSRDAAAIEGREKARPKRKRGRPRKGAVRPKELSRLERQQDHMTLSCILTSVSVNDRQVAIPLASALSHGGRMTCGFRPIRGAADALKPSPPKPGTNQSSWSLVSNFLNNAHRVSARASHVRGLQDLCRACLDPSLLDERSPAVTGGTATQTCATGDY